jgi:hypothetical protein
MVLAFGKDNYNLGAEELEALSKAVHNGDISVVMRAYENELKVKALFFHLVTASFKMRALPRLFYLDIHSYHSQSS